MPRKQGEHLEPKKVKSVIIKRIIQTDGEVREPDIRKFLEAEYGLVDQSTIHRHLQELKNKYGCIEKNPPLKAGLANTWDIKNVKNLKNIRQHFPAIPLNKYAKSLNMVFGEAGLDIFTIDSIKLYAQLSLSVTFFNIVLDVGMKKVSQRTWENYREKTEFKKITKLIEETTVGFYSEYIEPNPSFQISISEFTHILEEIGYKKGKLSSSVWNEKFSNLEKVLPLERFDIVEKKVTMEQVGQFFGELVEEIMDEKLPVSKSPLKCEEVLDILQEAQDIVSKIPIEEFKEKVFIKKYTEMFSDYDESMISDILADRKMYMELYKIFYLEQKMQSEFEDYQFYFLLDHCFNHDVLTETASSEETKYVKEFKKSKITFEIIEKERLANLDELNKRKTENIQENLLYEELKKYSDEIHAYLLSDLKIVSEIFVKHKLPLPSGQVYKKVEDAYQSLTQFFGSVIDINETTLLELQYADFPVFKPKLI